MLKCAIFLFMIISAGASTAASDQGHPSQDKEFRNDVFVKLSAKKYSEIERQYAGFLDAYAKGTLSEEELASKFEIFSKAFGLESRFDEWVKAYPKSYPATLARGVHRVSDAWEKRSGKFADETTDEQQRGFKEGLRNAAADLQASIKLDPRPIESYRHLMMVSMGLGLDAGRSLLDEALKIDPQAYYPRIQYQYMLTPKWGGSAIQMEEFLKECQNSPISAKNKKRLETHHYKFLGEQANYEKNYRQASDYYLKAYQHGDDPELLFWSGQSALDGSFHDLALLRFDALIKAHPKYEYGYTKRGFLYEGHFKNDKKAFDDYLAAAELGNGWAQNRVGWWYMTGRYVSQDYLRAEVYLRRAAAQNNKNAIANLLNLEKLRKNTDSVK